MGISRLQAFRNSISHGKENVLKDVKRRVNTTLTSISALKTYVVYKLTISKENREKIKSIPKKIVDFIKENKSLLFFGLSVLFSYYMAPAAAFEYLAKTNLSLKSTFVSGMTLGAGLLALKNILVSYPIRKTNEKNNVTQDDKINYLLGIANLCQIYINPAQSLLTSIGAAGFMAVKTAYRFLLPSDEIKKDKTSISFLVPRELSEIGNGRDQSVHAQ